MLFAVVLVETVTLVTWRLASSVSPWAAFVFASTTALMLLYSWVTK